MKRFTIETPGGKRLTIEAPDEATAIRGAEEWHTQQQQPRVIADAPPMGSDGQSGDAIRAANAGDTRAKMATQDISAAYDVAQQRGDRPEQQAMARAYVERERTDSPIMTGIGDRFRSVARGIPFIGEYLDEANATTAALLGNNREKALDYERARDSTFDAANPVQSLAGKAVGGIAGTIAALPAATATGTGILLGAGAKTVPGAIARGATAGVLQGAASGYGREGTAQGAMKDAAIGGVLGAAVPAALSLGKTGFDRVRDALSPGDALSAVPRKARAFFEQQFSPDAMGKLRTDLENIGPNGVLADVSPEMLGIAQGAASKPGSRGAIVDALTARDAGKNVRLSQSLDDTLGPVVEPSSVQAGIKEGMDDVGSRYGDVMRQNASRVETKPIADQLDTLAIDLRGPAQKAVREVRQMLNIPGVNELDPSPNALFQTRQAIDGLMANEANPKVIAQLTMARQSIDDELARAVPGIKQVDGQFQELARQRGALDEGTRLLRQGPEAVRPADLASRISGAAEPAGTAVGPSGEMLRLSQGARAEIDRIVGSNANDVAAMRNAMKGEGDWNRDKLRMIFGDEKASRILKVLDNESQMEATKRLVVDGSQTGVKQGFREFIDDAGKGINVPAEASGVGLALRGGKKIFEKVTGSNNEAQAARFADDLGRLSISGGKEAQAIIDALVKRQSRAQSGVNMNETFGRIGAGTARADDPSGIKAAIAAALMARDTARNRASDQSGSRR